MKLNNYRITLLFKCYSEHFIGIKGVVLHAGKPTVPNGFDVLNEYICA